MPLPGNISHSQAAAPQRPSPNTCSFLFQHERWLPASRLPGWGSCKSHNPWLGLQTCWGPHTLCTLPAPRDRPCQEGQTALLAESCRVPECGNTHPSWSQPGSPAGVGRNALGPWEDPEGPGQHSHNASMQLYLHSSCWPGIKAGSSQTQVWNKISATMGSAGQESGQSYVDGEFVLEEKCKCRGWMLSGGGWVRESD